MVARCAHSSPRIQFTIVQADSPLIPTVSQCVQNQLRRLSATTTHQTLRAVEGSCRSVEYS
eukprot:5637613-Heterocapsa_arctica.AAC.1